MFFIKSLKSGQFVAFAMNFLGFSKKFGLISLKKALISTESAKLPRIERMISKFAISCVKVSSLCKRLIFIDTKRSFLILLAAKKSKKS